MIASSEQTILRPDDDCGQVAADSFITDDEIRKIRHEFDAARQCFHKVPKVLKGMPKMNPKGLLCFCFDFKFDLIHRLSY